MQFKLFAFLKIICTVLSNVCLVVYSRDELHESYTDHEYKLYV